MPKKGKLSSKGQPAQEEKKRDADRKRLQKRRQHESQEETNQRREQVWAMLFAQLSDLDTRP